MITLKIASGDTDSDIVPLSKEEGTVFSKVILPTMTGTTLTFKGGLASDAMSGIADEFNTPFTLQDIATNKVRNIGFDKLSGITYVQVVSNSAEGAERIIYLTTKL